MSISFFSSKLQQLYTNIYLYPLLINIAFPTATDHVRTNGNSQTGENRVISGIKVHGPLSLAHRSSTNIRELHHWSCPSFFRYRSSNPIDETTTTSSTTTNETFLPKFKSKSISEPVTESEISVSIFCSWCVLSRPERTSKWTVLQSIRTDACSDTPTT